ncbi:LCP family protein [Allostreptomyces psammosilenae]|uniref:LCP family protein required for cell wall assembly n=1 Tax=Allostreptomyces psammosilenae TaxID=1892865 RepID=A0A852ZXF0_9ACTN|nr:LCP family protein [Allostreptomyces psammosilenae]NYI06417.1 LCP family protein required for cell wall assembly [Allostreptomyces psammosilenae]
MHSRRAGRRRRRTLTAVTAALLVVLGTVAAGLWFRLDGKLSTVDLGALLGDDRPAKTATGATDILVLGTDTRAGDNGEVVGGSEKGAGRSDTAMVVHLAEGRRSATVVSIPRDTLVDRPPCVTPEGHTAPREGQVAFNTAYATGGPACAVKTVEAMSGLRVDHVVAVDFAGFAEIVDALGGVEITVDQAIHDPYSDLDLAPGTHRLDGEQALAFVRTRHGVGDGSDLGRIELQQRFLRALVAEVGGTGLLGDPPRLYRVAEATAEAVTTDEELRSLDDLVSLARSLSGLREDAVRTVTLPVAASAGDPNRVVPVEGEAEALWAALRADREPPG